MGVVPSEATGGGASKQARQLGGMRLGGECAWRILHAAYLHCFDNASCPDDFGESLLVFMPKGELLPLEQHFRAHLQALQMEVPLKVLHSPC